MWLVLLFLLASPQVMPPPAERPTLVVQVVDPDWLPISGAEVTINLLSGKRQRTVLRADKDGYARFPIELDKDYSIEAKLPGFKTARVKPFHLFPVTGENPTAYIQLRLKIDMSKAVTVS